MVKVLIIAGLQVDFMPTGALKVPGANKVIPIINSIMHKFDHVLATRDWHPANHISFASAHPGYAPGDEIEIDSRIQYLWPNHCVQNTPGAELVKGLQRQKIEMIFHKGTKSLIDSYSVFFDSEKRQATGLYDYLQKHGWTDLYFCGLTTDFCILNSVKDAVELGYRPTVIADACCGLERVPGDSQRAFDKMGKIGAKIITSNDL